MYLDRLLNRLREEEGIPPGITFQEFKIFCQFLNNLEDFTIAMRMYTLADHPISKSENWKWSWECDKVRDRLRCDFSQANSIELWKFAPVLIWVNIWCVLCSQFSTRMETDNWVTASLSPSWRIGCIEDSKWVEFNNRRWMFELEINGIFSNL